MRYIQLFTLALIVLAALACEAVSQPTAPSQVQGVTVVPDGGVVTPQHDKDLDRGGPNRPGRVGICHLPGHDGDYVLGNQNRGGLHRFCHSLEGRPIWIKPSNCRNTHDAAPSPNNGDVCEDF